MTFFFDAHFAFRIARALTEIGIPAEHVSDVLGPGTEDTVWIAYAAERRYVVFTGDIHTRTRPAERVALEKAGLTVFFVRPGVLHQHAAEDQLLWFLRHKRAIVEAVEKSNPGTHFEIGQRGKITRLNLGVVPNKEPGESESGSAPS